MLQDRPSYDDSCPIEVSENPAASTDQSNLAVLAAVSALEVHAPSGGDDADSRSAEFQALDSKLNVLIQMFAGFWRAQCALPEPVPMTVSASGLQIAMAPALTLPKRPLSVKLYLHPALPQSLILPVARCETRADGVCVMEFGEVSEDVQDALARHVFRRHRRALAQQRGASNLHGSDK